MWRDDLQDTEREDKRMLAAGWFRLGPVRQPVALFPRSKSSEQVAVSALENPSQQRRPLWRRHGAVSKDSEDSPGLSRFQSASLVFPITPPTTPV